MEIRTIAEAEAYLTGFINLERQRTFDYQRLGLERIRLLCAAVGHPEASLPAVHIAGSNGKCSVALCAESLLSGLGMRVGTYTSPHLERWQERYRIDGRSVSEQGLLSALAKLVPAAERLRADPGTKPSFFDVSTALAFLIFQEAGVEVGVIEVGLGGRIDSTNVVEPRVSVITAIHLEHTDKLGETHAEIAFEKAGIMREGVPVVCGPLESDALGVVLARSIALDTEVEVVSPRDVRVRERGLDVVLADGRSFRTGVEGRHQATNLALGLRAVEHFLGRALTPPELTPLERLRLPARLERFGDVVVDVAHCKEAVDALCATLEESDPGRRYVLVLSISRDKDAAAMLQRLAANARACVVTKSEPIRSLGVDELEPLAWACGIESVESVSDPVRALARARSLAAPGELVVVVGSLYLAGAVRRALCSEFGVPVE